MQDNISKLKNLLENLKSKVANDDDAMELIDHALNNLERGVNFDKVVFELNHDLDNYSLSHNFKLPQPLTKLKILLNENPDKWKDAGLTGSI